ncbi:MAG: hypothetical protein ACRDO8_03370 [Nocardioidaceae bacterium]
MDLNATIAPVPAATLGAARMRVSDSAFASFGDVCVGKGINVRTVAPTAPGLYAWSPPS